MMEMQETELDRRRAMLDGTFSGFRALAGQLAACDARLRVLAEGRPEAVAAKARGLRRKIRAFEPSLTMIGQVKAGKTTLVNAMTGWRRMLPADVNPWTSVVTSLHLRPGTQWATRNASFTFFTEEEWTNLVRNGGRMGQLANRAGADDELARVRRQLEQMRQKSRDRLGTRFEMLLGQSHDYESFDPALIERYVCLGDDDWDDAEGAAEDRGRYADITRTADLWLEQPGLPLGLCLRDTPGVNDTFMIREQITLNALRGSRLCVMVLSATQALSSVDLALIRMISNVDTRDVIIFVNRIDELGDPAREVPEIRDSIRETLRRQGGPANAEILFGCGFWAGHVLSGGVEEMGQGSAEALLAWAEANHDEAERFDSLEALVWHQSGMHALWDSIARRVSDGMGAQVLREVETEIGNLEQSLAAANRVTAYQGSAGSACLMEPAEVAMTLEALTQTARTRLMTGLLPLREDLETRIGGARRTFVGRATAVVVKHLESYGELDLWTYDPSGLRVLLRSGFQRYVTAVTRHAEACLEETAAEIRAFYGTAFDLGGDAPEIQPPVLPRPEPPLVLGQTIALDLRGTWWSRFWRRRKGYQACADDFADLIRQETQPIVDALLNGHARQFEQAVVAVQADFLEANRRVLLEMAASGDSAAGFTPAPTARAPQSLRQESTA